MRFRFAMLLLVALFAGCANTTGTRSFSVFFQPYSSELDQQARETVTSAADFARGHPGSAIELIGYSAPEPSRNVEGLSAQRAASVKQTLVAGGVGPDRITTVANGATSPNGLPTLAVRRVDINVGP